MSETEREKGALHGSLLWRAAACSSRLLVMTEKLFPLCVQVVVMFNLSFEVVADCSLSKRLLILFRYRAELSTAPRQRHDHMGRAGMGSEQCGAA